MKPNKIEILFEPPPVGCYSEKMKKLASAFEKVGLIGILLTALVVLFAGVLAVGWNASVDLRKTVAANAEVMNVDSSALIELERLRSLAESQITNSRAYFLLGSKALLDKQKDEKQRFREGMAKFVAENPLPQISDIAATLEKIQTQEAEFFEQGVGFREKATESKIVAQFYQSKTSPLLAQMNEQFDTIEKLQNAKLAEARALAVKAGADAQAQIPRNMIWFMSSVTALFLAASLLVIWLLVTRNKQQKVRDRLYMDAQKSALHRDEVLSAVGFDMKAPLATLSEVAKTLSPESGALVEGVIEEINTAVSDILDQKRADMDALTLRLEQLPVSGVLDDAKAMLTPMAKRRDITLQVDNVSQSVLAYVDRERVLRVLANLIGNAIKFSPRNSTIQVKVKGDAQFANISVIDSGPGISEARLANIFEDFWQARTTADQGPGIGLAVVKTIIESHGGTVKAEKNLATGGTSFTFSLPRRRPAGAVLKKPSRSTPATRPTHTAYLHSDESPLV